MLKFKILGNLTITGENYHKALLNLTNLRYYSCYVNFLEKSKRNTSSLCCEGSSRPKKWLGWVSLVSKWVLERLLTEQWEIFMQLLYWSRYRPPFRLACIKDWGELLFEGMQSLYAEKQVTVEFILLLFIFPLDTIQLYILVPCPTLVNSREILPVSGSSFQECSLATCSNMASLNETASLSLGFGGPPIVHSYIYLQIMK